MTITPNLKAFLNESLPGSEGGHVLALGEDHRQIENKRFIETNLRTLQQEHNLGALGIEMPPYFEVFNWAYRDGNLPVPKSEAKTYLRNIYRCISNGDAVAKANMAIAALDAGLPVISFNTRQKLPAMQLQFEYLFQEHPELQTTLRNGSAFDNIVETARQCDPKFLASLERPIPEAKRADTIKQMLQEAFLIQEAKTLLKKNPAYQQRLDNLEAVIDAGKTFHPDAADAALFAAQMPNGKNAITLSGSMHVTDEADGASWLLQDHGSFDLHLGKKLKVTTALAGSQKELQDSLLGMVCADRYGDRFAKSSRTELPTFMVTDADRVIRDRDMVGTHPEGSLAAQLTAAKTRHAERHRKAASHKAKAQGRIDREESTMAKSKPLQTALERVRDQTADISFTR